MLLPVTIQKSVISWLLVKSAEIRNEWKFSDPLDTNFDGVPDVAPIPSAEMY